MLALSVCVGLLLPLACYAVTAALTFRRLVRYCEHEAEQHPFASDLNNAYSDMATVITLGGRCTYRSDLERSIQHDQSPAPSAGEAP